MKKLFLVCCLVGLFVIPSVTYAESWRDYTETRTQNWVPLDDGRRYFEFTCKSKFNGRSGYVYREGYMYYINDLSERRQTGKGKSIRRLLQIYCLRK